MWFGRAAALASVLAVLVGTFVYLENLKYSTRELNDQMIQRFDQKQDLDDKWVIRDDNDHGAILKSVRDSHVVLVGILSAIESVKAQNLIIIAALSELSYRLGQHSCQEAN